MNRFRRSLGTLALALAAAILPGCTTAPPPLGDAERSALYQRVDEIFAQAILLKPAPTLPEELPVVRLAPLLLLETVDTNVVAAFPIRPVVFFREDTASWNGGRHPQLTYLWRPDSLPSPAPGAAPWQGLRATLNAAGEPVLWELLGERGRATLLFVARSLETAARTEFGDVLPGRRFAVERALTETPDVIVLRVIEDGPMPMGPIAHLGAAQGDITTLVCRCTPPQVQSLAGGLEYELSPADFGPPDPALAPPSDPARPRRLLRWPAGF